MIPVSVIDELKSTQSAALSAFDEVPNGGRAVAVRALRQSGGVGRSGRKWQSPDGGLWLTLAWPHSRPAVEYSAAPLAVGLATARAIESATGARATIKWPNDIRLRELKVAGILCETRIGVGVACLLAGIGINVNFSISELSGKLQQPATSLLDVTGRKFDLQILTEVLLGELESTLETLERDGVAGIREQVEERLDWVGSVVHGELIPGGEAIRGVFEGIDDSGAAKLRRSKDVEIFHSMELLHLHAD